MNCIWVKLREDISWRDWWPKFQQQVKWPKDLLIERWDLNSESLATVIDSYRTFTLFKQQKVLLLSHFEKQIKNKEDLKKYCQLFEKGQHFVIFVSQEQCPDKEMSQWEHIEETNAEKVDDRVAFRWIDAIHMKKFDLALTTLEDALMGGQPPLVLLQLLTRDFRLGRLIHYAREQRMPELEMSQMLKTPLFAIQKWAKRAPTKNSLWAAQFDLLFWADWEIKSGKDSGWVLRKLTYDLVQMRQDQMRTKTKRLKPSWKPELQLWTASPSFA